MFIVLLNLAEKIVDMLFANIPRRNPSAEHIKKARLIAHRGAHYNNMGIFENTHEAFRLAKECGCWGVELDVHTTADKVLVVNHDPNLHRLWGRNVEIAQLTFSALRTLVPEIPSLAEVVAEYGTHMHLFIELKSPFQNEEALVQTLEGLSPCQDYHLLSLDPFIFNTFSQFPKQSLLLVAVHNNAKEFCDLSIKENYGGVLGNYLLLSNKRIQELEAAHQQLGVGFVNSKNSLYRELTRGINWIFTNEVVDMSRFLKSLQ